MRRRIALLLALILAATSVTAWAIWSAASSSTSNGAAVGATVNGGATPTASGAAGRTVTVSWGASTLSNGHAVDGYLIKRYISGGALQSTLAGCSGTITTTSCIESDVPAGSWRYTVTPVIGTNWQGAEGSQSGVVTIAAAVLTLAKTLFGAPLPASTTGSVTGFAASEGLTYRLDGGTSLSGSPSSVSSSGTATISSLTIPSTTDGAHTVYALGDASPLASQASVGIVTDTVAPTVVAQLTPAANLAGWNNTTPVAVALSATDGTGSGVNQVTYTTDGSDPTTSGTAVVYATPLSLSANTTVKFFATDNAGNASSVQTQLVKIDTTAPANAVTLSSVSGGAVLSGTTIYYRGPAIGSVNLTNTLTDTGGSGVASSGTAALAGTSTGFSHTSSLVTTPSGGPYVSNAFSWSAGTSSSPTESVTGSDVAGNTATTVLSFVDDALSASGGSVDATGLVGTGGRYALSQTLQIAFTKGTDAGSGLAASGSQLLRASGTLSSGGTSDGACTSYGSYAQIGSNDPASAVTDVVPSDNACYRYEYTVPDKVGNVATYTSGDIKVETTTPGSLTPTAGVLAAVTGASSFSGSTVYYNPAQSGSFTFDSQSSDVRSGVAQVAFPAIGGFAGGGNVSTPNTGTTFRTTYSWSANGASASPGAQSVTATNNATSTATNASTFSVIKDATGPAGGSVDATGLVGTGSRYSTSTTLSVAFAKGTDGGSGVAASGAQLLRSSATLSSGGTSDGTCGTYGSYAQVGTDDPTSPKSDSVPSDHTCYRYEYVVGDNVANQTTYTSGDIKVDTTAPAAPGLGFSAFTNASATGTVVYYQPAATPGGFTVTGTASDLFSGIASFAFPSLPSGWTSTPGALGVEVYSHSAANPTAPSGNQNVTATNNAGLASAAAAFTVVADSTAPAGGSVTYTTAFYTTASVSVTFTPGTDGGSGVNAASGLLQRASATLSANTCGGYGAFATIVSNPTSPYADTSVSTGNCYEYRYLISDAVGNQATYTSASVAKVDTQAPTQAFTLTSPVNASLTGTTLYYNGALTGSFKFVDTLTDLVSGVASATFPSIATTGWTHLTETQNGAGPFTSTSFSWTASPGVPSGYLVTGTDTAGNSGTAAVSFFNDTTAPTGGSISYTTQIYNTLSVPITLTSATDGAGSGIATAVVKRDQIGLTPLTETCGTPFPGTFATTVTLVGGNDTSVTTGHCYQYEYVVTDSVGNAATFTSASVATVDTSGPQITRVVSQDPGGGASTGTLVVGAKLILTFNQSLATASVPTSVASATETRTGGLLSPPHVFLTILGITEGALDTGTPNYFGGCVLFVACVAQQATFAADVVLSNGGTSTTVTVTVTSIASGGDPSTQGSGSLSFVPASTITDSGNHGAIGTITTAGSFKLF